LNGISPPEYRSNASAASVAEQSTSDPTATTPTRPGLSLSEFNGNGNVESEEAHSADDAKSRLQQELSRQRSLGGSSMSAVEYDNLLSEKEKLRRLRTGEDPGLDERERLRRLRISIANKGRKPWNTGKRHSTGEGLHPSHSLIGPMLPMHLLIFGTCRDLHLLHWTVQ
jgi:hypothetical protein